MGNSLLVEGQIDKLIVQSIINLNQPMPEICVRPSRGIGNLIKNIKNIIKAEDTKAVGIMVDANSDLIERWNSITCQIRSAGINLSSEINLPDNPDPRGVIIKGTPRVGVWMMPDNKTPGEIEDFIAKLIPHSDPIWPKSQRYIDSISEEHRRFSSAKITKAKTYAWVSTRKRPGLIDSAINSQDLDLTGETYKNFVAWLRELFREG